MAQSLKLFGTAFISILIIDYIWLNLIAKKFYVDRLSEVGRFENGEFSPVLWAAGVVYILLALGVVLYVLPGMDADANLFSVFLKGALLGLIIYGVYDMTNLATLKSWPISLAVTDMAWGAFVTGAASTITAFVQRL